MAKKSQNIKLPWFLIGAVVLVVLLFCLISFWRQKSQVQPVPEFVLNGAMRQTTLTAEPLDGVAVAWLGTDNQRQNYTAKGLRWSGLASQLNPVADSLRAYFQKEKFKFNEINGAAGSLETVTAYQLKNLACRLKMSLAGPDEGLGIEDLRQQVDAQETLELVCFELK